jgi:hypothetical protein
VRWLKPVNVSLNGATLKKTGGANDGRWDGGAFSEQTLKEGDGYVEFAATGPFVYRAIGLIADDKINGDHDPERFDFAVFLININLAEFRTHGGYVGDTTFNPGNVFRIAIEGDDVNFYRKGELMASSKKKVSYPLRVIASFSYLGGELSNAKLVSPRAGAIVLRRGSAPDRSLDPREADPVSSPQRYRQ